MTEKASVLIVDDNTALCESMSLILEERGYDVTRAGDGPEAIEIVTERSFDIIFMDIKMPLMDGVEAYKRIKGIRPEAVVMMMTAYSLEEMVQEALQEGAYGILYKPLDMAKVIATIDEVAGTGSGALILVVDDDPGACTSLKDILEARGCRVGTAHSGEEAIAMAREMAFDIIFIDVKLPALNGLETYMAIRGFSPGSVAVMMTAYRYEMADLVEEALSNSAYTCLYKPLDMDQVLRLVDEILEKKRKSPREQG